MDGNVLIHGVSLIPYTIIFPSADLITVRVYIYLSDTTRMFSLPFLIFTLLPCIVHIFEIT